MGVTFRGRKGDFRLRNRPKQNGNNASLIAVASSYEQQIRFNADVSPAERAVNRLSSGLNKVEKLARGALDGLKKTTRLEFDTRGAEQQLARLQRGISGLSQRVRVRVEEVYTRNQQDQGSGGGGGAAIISPSNNKSTAALGAAALAVSQLQKAQEAAAPAAKQVSVFNEDIARTSQRVVAAQAKVEEQTAKVAAAQRRYNQAQGGIGDKGKTIAQSQRDAKNALESTTNWLNRYQRELAEAAGDVQYLTAAESALEKVQARRTATQQRLAKEREALYRPTAPAFGSGGGGGKPPGNIGAGLLAGAAFTSFPGQQGVQAFGAGQLLGGIKGGIAAVVAQATIELGKAAGPAATYAAELKKLQIALQSTSTSQAEFQRTLQGINAIANSLNIPLAEATQQVTQLRAAMLASGYSAEETLRVYKALASANTALGGDSQRLQGILLATTQVFSKGKVSAEELRGQIGERLAGAFAEFARASGISTQQLDAALSKGEVSLDQFLKFTDYILKKYEANAQKIADAPAAAGDRLAKKLKDLQGSIGTLLQPIGAAFQSFASKAVNELQFVIDKLNELLGLGRDSKNNRLYDLEQNKIKQLQSQVDTLLADGVKGPYLTSLKAQLKQYREEAARLRAELFPPSTAQLGKRPDPNAPDPDEQQKALEKELGIRGELRQLAIQQAEVEAAAGRIGKDRLSQLYAQGDAMEKLLRMQLDDIGASQDDPRLKQAKTGLAIATYQREGKQLQQEIDEALTSLKELELEAQKMRRTLLGGQLAPTESPLQAQIRQVKEELQDADQEALQLLRRLDELGGTRPETTAARTALGNLRGDIAETDPRKLASQRLTQGDQQGLEETQRALQLQVAALKQGRTELTGMEQLLQRYGADWENLDSTVKGHLVDLARTNDALAQQLQQLQQIRADAEALSGITVTGIQEALVASVTGGDVRAAFASMFEQLGNQFLTMGLRPVQEWLTNEIAKLLGLTLTDGLQAAATNANTTAVAAATTTITSTVVPTVTANTSALAANTAAVAANTAAQAGGAAANAAGSAASGILGFAGSVFGVAGSGFGGGAFGAGFNPLSTTKLFSGGIFAGGGYTGDAPRSGGIDGQGGFPAILHPQETVIDHTRPTSEMREAMARYSPGQASLREQLNESRAAGGGGGADPVINIQTGNTLTFEGTNYVSRGDFQMGLAQAAKQGAALGEKRMLDRLRNSPGTRKRLGM